MQYRHFGKLDWKVSALGFGGFRLPIVGDDRTAVDEPEAIQMLRYAIDHGVNYIDTGYTYHGGNSEVIIGRVLQDGYREKVRITTKLPTWNVKTLDDCDRFLDEQLERLRVDDIDFYLLHALGLPGSRWSRVRDLGIIDWAERAMVNGRFRHFGFSFHGTCEAFRQIVDDYDGWDVCTILYNYVDEDYQAGRRGLEYAAEKGIAVAVMEPLRGGGLTDKIPPSIQALWDTAPRKRTPADWGLQWVWNHSEVSVVLSGMSTMAQVEQNVESACKSGPGTLTEDELALIARVRNQYLEKITVRCSKCEYCMPCPSGVNIPRIFEFYNEAIMFDDLFGGRMRYNSWLSEEELASSCVQCGECMEKCPQQIEIPQRLAEAHELLCVRIGGR